MPSLLVFSADYSQPDARAISLDAILPVSVAGIATNRLAGKVRCR